MTPNHSPDAEAEPLASYHLGATVLRARYDIVRISFLFAIITSGWMLTRPRYFTSTAAVLPIATSGAKSGLAAISAQFGLSVPGGDPSQSPAFYVELLHSRELLHGLTDTLYVADSGDRPFRGTLADLFHVSGVKPTERRDATMKKLSSLIEASSNTKTGIVRFSVSTPSPSVSRQVCERAIASLIAFNQQRRQSQASAERKFVEQRLRDFGAELNAAENRLAAFLAQNRSSQNSAVLRLQEDRLRRDVAARQQVFTSLLQAFEQARIEEVRDTPTLTMFEAPETPLRPAPRGTVAATLAALVVGGLLGLCIGLARDFRRRASDEASNAAEFSALWRASVAELRHPLRTAARLARLRDGRE